ncbi:MAG: potassium transporter TrkG, partial [Myxococcota bacterium]
LATTMMVHGIEPMAALFETMSTLSTVGLSVGVTSSSLPDAVLWAQSVGMYLGRLEMMVVVVVVLRGLTDGRAAVQASLETRAARSMRGR